MSARLVKLHLIVAQLMPLVTMAEYLLAHSVYSFALTVPVLFTLGLYRCQSCNTPIWDSRIIGTRVPIRPSVIDSCGVCRRPMFGGD